MFRYYNGRILHVQVQEDLLHELQSRAVISLLHKAISMVKEDPKTATNVTLFMVDTPTSSPTQGRKEFKLPEMRDEGQAAKVRQVSIITSSRIGTIIVKFYLITFISSLRMC